jgi:adenosyl cobinamide kinase/adenosyl cobinamide phosphate guanylyltransferase
MTTLMTIVTIVFCIGVVFAIVGHLGIGVALDRNWRERIARHHEARRRWSRQTARDVRAG